MQHQIERDNYSHADKGRLGLAILCSAFFAVAVAFDFCFSDFISLGIAVTYVIKRYQPPLLLLREYNVSIKW